MFTLQRRVSGAACDELMAPISFERRFVLVLFGLRRGGAHMHAGAISCEELEIPTTSIEALHKATLTGSTAVGEHGLLLETFCSKTVSSNPPDREYKTRTRS